MRKTLLFIILIVIDFNVIDAQHLRFSGIPIDGNITNFQSKLAAKGIKINHNKSIEAPAGQRVFNGFFLGYNSEITVFYNRKSNDVYKVVAKIESPKMEIIQGILDRSLTSIEQKYIYKPLHDLDDTTKLHFQYYIFPTKESNEWNGIIHVKPSYTYYIPNNFSVGQKLELASYIITFEYEDALNTSRLTPSTTEPTCSRWFSCSKPENYGNFLSWANNYKKQECYERCIYFLTFVLDYYKYDCIPVGNENYEETLEQTIMTLRSRQIGRIKTAYYKEYANVYYVFDEITNQFKYIQYDVCDDLYHIKLDANNITKQINALEKLKNIYAEKKKDIVGRQLDEYWSEDINLTMPALIGQEGYSKVFGDLKWNSYNLTMEFRQYNQELRVAVIFKDYMEILLFRSEAEIDDYLEFLKANNPLMP